MKIFTHKHPDFDGLAAINVLRRFAQNKLPEIESAEIVYWDGNKNTVPQENVVFVDTCPEGIGTNSIKNIYVFDHHPHESHPWKPESKNPWERLHTATSKIVQFLELDLDDPKIAELVRWAYRADFNSGGDSMNVCNILREMHFTYSEQQVYQWVAVMVEAHFQSNEIDLQKGLEFFKEVLGEFLSKNVDSSAKAIFQRWLERAENSIEDNMNIVSVTAMSLEVFGPQKAKDWLMTGIKGIDGGQKLFQQARLDFEKAEKMMVGRRTLIIGESSNPKFGHFARSKIARDLMPRSMGQKGTPIVVQIQGPDTGFQIYSNRKGYRVADVVGALRVEILKTRNKRIPTDWRTLKSGGTLSGTDPLYYHLAVYEIVMWGSLTISSVRPVDISMETVKRAVIISLDPDYFPTECQQSEKCLNYDCSLYPWQLARCGYKRRNKAF